MPAGIDTCLCPHGQTSHDTELSSCHVSASPRKVGCIVNSSDRSMVCHGPSLDQALGTEACGIWQSHHHHSLRDIRSLRTLAADCCLDVVMGQMHISTRALWLTCSIVFFAPTPECGSLHLSDSLKPIRQYRLVSIG